MQELKSTKGHMNIWKGQNDMGEKEGIFVKEVKNGWCDIVFKDDKNEKTLNISYVCDFPFNVLQSFQNYADTKSVPAIYGDGEDKEYIFVADSFDLHIIANDEEGRNTLTTFNIKIGDFINGMLHDLELFCDEFAHFVEEYDEEEILLRKMDILRNILEIKKKL